MTRAWLSAPAPSTVRYCLSRFDRLLLAPAVIYCCQAGQKDDPSSLPQEQTEVVASGGKHGVDAVAVAAFEPLR
jgi:hypothetical protein